MRKIVLAILFSTLVSPAWATTYYLATATGGGSDSNTGTSASTPWLTPNHAVNCGDILLAAPGIYSPTSFSYNAWGAVTCPAGNNVAWLKCATFDTCFVPITGTGTTDGFHVDNNYWGVQGWEVDGSSTSIGSCFIAYPDNHSIHHIIFANDIANGCGGNGFNSSVYCPTVCFGVDYIVIVGNIAYNSAMGSTYCTSGISVFEPIASDTNTGTHIFIAGNFSYGNVDPNPCAGEPPSDGEGVILDTFNGFSYSGQTVVDNNILVANGGRGLLALNTTPTPIIFRHNTVWGNNTETDETGVGDVCDEISAWGAHNLQAFYNLSVTNEATSCGSVVVYAYYMDGGDFTDIVNNNVGWSATASYASSTNTNGFSYGSSNLFGTTPSFANAVAPSQPSCGSLNSVPACMAAVVANFTPTTATVQPYGYQTPGTTQAYDPLFPKWLCNVNLPAGLVTMGCLAQSSLPASPTITSVTVQ